MAPERVVHVLRSDAENRGVAAPLLQSSGFIVVVHETDDALLEAVSASTTGCILLDLREPTEDALTSQLGALVPYLPVIVTTRQDDLTTAVAAMKAGAVDFLVQPFIGERLALAVETAFSDPKGVLVIREIAGAARRIGSLSRRERQVLDAIISGHPTKIIAHDLAISIRTVEVHRAHLLERLGLRTMAEAIRLAVLATLAPTDHRDAPPPLA
jgi:two-component system response regulator FixJ